MQKYEILRYFVAFKLFYGGYGQTEPRIFPGAANRDANRRAQKQRDGAHRHAERRDRHRRNDHIAQRDFRIQARDRRETERIRLPCSDRQPRRERFVRNGSHFEKPAVPVANPQRAEFFGNVSLCRHDRHSARGTRDAGRRTEGSGQHVRLVVFPTKPRGGRTARRAKRRPHQGYRGLPFAGGPARSFGRGSAGNAVHPGSAAARPLPGRGHLRHAVQRNRPHDGADRPTQRPATQRVGFDANHRVRNRHVRFRTAGAFYGRRLPSRFRQPDG